MYTCNIGEHTSNIGVYRHLSPVPKLSFPPAPYRGLTWAVGKRVQDNLHAHAQKAKPNTTTKNNYKGKKTYLEGNNANLGFYKMSEIKRKLKLRILGFYLHQVKVIFSAFLLGWFGG